MNRKQKICQSIKWITAVNKRKFFSSSFHFLVDIYLIHWILMKLTLIFFWGGSWTLSFQCEFNDKWKKRTQKSSFESQKQEKILRSIYLRKKLMIIIIIELLMMIAKHSFFYAGDSSNEKKKMKILMINYFLFHLGTFHIGIFYQFFSRCFPMKIFWKKSSSLSIYIGFGRD